MRDPGRLCNAEALQGPGVPGLGCPEFGYCRVGVADSSAGLSGELLFGRLLKVHEPVFEAIVGDGGHCGRDLGDPAGTA